MRPPETWACHKTAYCFYVDQRDEQHVKTLDFSLLFCYNLAMPKYQVSFIVEQLYYDEVEANSPEEALSKHEENPDYILGDWNEVQPDSYEVEEIK